MLEMTMTNPELQPAELARVRAELAHALAANQAAAALEALIARIDARLAQVAPQPMAATRQAHRSTPLRTSTVNAPRVRGFFAG
jgi:hypothetical protein